MVEEVSRIRRVSRGANLNCEVFPLYKAYFVNNLENYEVTLMLDRLAFRWFVKKPK